MKRAAALLSITLGFLAPAAAPAQTPKSEASAEKALDMQVNLVREDWRDQKKQIVAANVPLTGDEAAKFWPLYTDYTQQLVKVFDQRYALIKEYAASYSSMDDKVASSLVRRWVAVDDAAAKVRMQWLPKFEQALGAKKAAMFFQIERRLMLIQDLEIASQIPLVQP